MYTTQKNVQILIALLKKYGVRYAVISPGSRNMPLVRSLENDQFFTCFSVVDERSAAYFAIGVSIEKNCPVLISCTSAQATRNYIPAMTEAYYRGVPLVTVTADYRPSLIGQGTMQSLNQMSIPVDSRKTSVQLPVIQGTDDENYCARLVNEALLELDHHGTGPVHIDIPTDELWAGSVDTLPTVKKIDRYVLGDDMPDLDSTRKILVAIGEHAPFTDAQQRALDSFSKSYNAVVYTNHLSNYHGPHSVNANLILEAMDSNIFKDFRPDLVITIGDQIGDYSLDNKMKSSKPEHWRVHQDGVVRDTYGTLTKIFELKDEDFFGLYANQSKKQAATGYFEKWLTVSSKKIVPDTIPLSHAYVAATLAPRIPANSIMHFAILNSLRNWNFFDIDKTVHGYSNVAAFGIDGCMSTFLGHSVATEKLSFLVIGDLSFFYDMNSIGIRHIKNNARIVLVNNKGGGEFRLFNHPANEFGDDANTHIAAGGHNGSAQAWVESMGWKYVKVETKDQFSESIDALVGESDAPVLVEVFTTMKADSDGVQQMIETNSRVSLQGKIYRKMGPKMKRTAKKILKK